MEKCSGFFFSDLDISIQVSAALSHRRAASLEPLDVLRWAYMNGIAPYRAEGESSPYSKTSRLYNRYGSEYSPCPPEVHFRENDEACSGIP